MAIDIALPAKGGVGHIRIVVGATHWHMRDLRLIRPQEMTTDHALRVLRIYCNCRWVRNRTDRWASKLFRRAEVSPWYVAAKQRQAARQVRAAAWSDSAELIQYRLKVAEATVPLAQELSSVLTARGVERIAVRLALLGDVFVPSDYSGVRLWSKSPPGKISSPSSELDASYDVA